MAITLSNEEYEQAIDYVQQIYEKEWRRVNTLYKNSPKNTIDVSYQDSLITERVSEATCEILSKITGLDFDPKVGHTDYLSINIEDKSESITINNLQVDRHIWLNGQRYAFLENKTVLESAAFKKVLNDMNYMETACHFQGLNTKEIKFILLAAQNAIKEESLKGFQALLTRQTRTEANPKGLQVKAFCYLNGKRNPKYPLYACHYTFNREVFKEFLEYFLS